MRQSMSASCAASARVLREVIAATLFVINATPNCPRNMSAAKRRSAGLRPVDCHQSLIVCLPRPGGVPLDVLEAGRDKFLRRPAMPAASSEQEPADAIFVAGEVARFRDAVGEEQQAFARFHLNPVNRITARREHPQRNTGGADLLHAIL